MHMTPRQKQGILAITTDAQGEFYYNGKLDGQWGSKSQEAAERFLRDFTGEDVDTEPAKKPGDFWDEIKFFNREEFRCKCGGKYCNGYPAEPDERMVRIADQLRKNLEVPITIVSGLRCKAWNAIQGGASNSQHMYGEAADIYAKGVSQSRVEAELDKIGGVRYHYAIAGSSNVHFDVPKGSR